MVGWTAQEIPDQSGTVALVTGANSGLGLEIARSLAGHGAHVVLACRDSGRGGAAVANIRRTDPDASVELASLDLADLDAVRGFVENTPHEKIDTLVANAGVMAIPYRQTAQSFEMQMGTNHLGHFALTGLLLPKLLAADQPRVVVQSSGAHRIGTIDLGNLNSEKGYRKWRAYGASKLANLLFTYELARRAQARQTPLIAVAAHPGYAATNLQSAGARMGSKNVAVRVIEAANGVLGQSAAMGALPALYGATMPGVRPGEFFGPGELGGTRGSPVRTRSSAASHDAATAGALWDASETLTGVHFDWDASA